MPKPRLLLQIAAVAFALVSTACTTVNLQYRSDFGRVPPSFGAVTLTVLNSRKPGHGDDDVDRVGNMRSLVGIASSLSSDHEGALLQTVHAAVEDALSHSGVVSMPNTARELVVRVTEYWIDGYVRYTAAIAIDCELKDSHGATLWKEPLAAQAASVNPDVRNNSNFEVFAGALFEDALSDLAVKAAAKFHGAAFTEAVREPAPAQPLAASPQ
jgi:hypothetical protein